eukprot:3007837-Rhodomonas_salina.1
MAYYGPSSQGYRGTTEYAAAPSNLMYCLPYLIRAAGTEKGLRGYQSSRRCLWKACPPPAP